MTIYVAWPMLRPFPVLRSSFGIVA